jgi:RNA polymerase sigma-70 factor (ECF subfamily)
MTEQELIEGILLQRKDAVNYLVLKYQRSVIKTAYYFVSNMEDAEDLSQEVFLEVLKSVGRFNNKASISTWIYRITVNKSLDYLRKQKRRSVIQTMSSFFEFSSDGAKVKNESDAVMDTTNDDKEKRMVLDNAVNSLPENQRIAFVLSKYEELPYKEIAEIMNLSLSSVESLIHRAKLSLQTKLVTYFSDYAKKSK